MFDENGMDPRAAKNVPKMLSPQIKILVNVMLKGGLSVDMQLACDASTFYKTLTEAEDEPNKLATFFVLDNKGALVDPVKKVKQQSIIIPIDNIVFINVLEIDTSGLVTL